MENKLKYLTAIMFISIVACKSPVIITATKENIKDINCEVAFITNKKYSSIDDFKSDLKNKIIKPTNHCNCDTIYVDINDVNNTGYSNVIGGGCIEKK